MTEIHPTKGFVLRVFTWKNDPPGGLRANNIIEITAAEDLNEIVDLAEANEGYMEVANPKGYKVTKFHMEDHTITFEFEEK